MNSNKIRKIREDIVHLEKTISQAKRGNKIHFAKRLEIIIKKKKEILNTYNQAEY